MCAQFNQFSEAKMSYSYSFSGSLQVKLEVSQRQLRDKVVARTNVWFPLKPTKARHHYLDLSSMDAWKLAVTGSAITTFIGRFAIKGLVWLGWLSDISQVLSWLSLILTVITGVLRLGVNFADWDLQVNPSGWVSQ